MSERGLGSPFSEKDRFGLVFVWLAHSLFILLLFLVNLLSLWEFQTLAWPESIDQLTRLLRKLAKPSFEKILLASVP